MLKNEYIFQLENIGLRVLDTYPLYPEKITELFEIDNNNNDN